DGRLQRRVRIGTQRRRNVVGDRCRRSARGGLRRKPAQRNAERSGPRQHSRSLQKPAAGKNGGLPSRCFVLMHTKALFSSNGTSAATYGTFLILEREASTGADGSMCIIELFSRENDASIIPNYRHALELSIGFRGSRLACLEHM